MRWTAVSFEPRTPLRFFARTLGLEQTGGAMLIGVSAASMTVLHHNTLVQAAALLLLSLPALGQQPVRPLPKVGGCPLGYYSSGSYCVPSQSGNTRGAIEKMGGSSCPLGFYSSGNYCLSSPNNTREAIQKTGSSCPLGWFSSGSYCVKNR